jgi:alkylated DNA repair dioxygenase AlkB
VWLVCKGYVSPLQAQALRVELDALDDSQWIHKKNPFQPQAPTLRLNRWHHDAQMPYKFSGRYHAAVPITAHVDRLKTRLNAELPNLVASTRAWRQEAGFPSLNSVLVARYTGPHQSISGHSDNEFGRYPVIAGVVLGWGRKFVFKRMTEKQRAHECKIQGLPFRPNPDYRNETHILDLEDGDLLLMLGSTQEFWHHSVPKATEAEAEARQALGKRLVRYSLTYRTFSPNDGRQKMKSII